MKKWEVLSSEDIYSDNWVSFKNNSYRNGKGVVIDNYTIIKLKDYSVVFPLKRGEPLVSQFYSDNFPLAWRKRQTE